jgi:membrane-associated phospholipid phosphatase
MPRQLSFFFMVFCLAPRAAAREVDWAAELGADVVLAGSAYTIDRFSPRSARLDGGDFPTQGFDDAVHRAVHPAAVHDWRAASNVTVGLAGALPAAAAFAVDDDETLGRILTTGHALLLSNLGVEALKKTVRRPRPTARHRAAGAVDGDEAYSFPSGHSAAAFTGATLVSQFFPSNLGLAVGAYLLAGATAYARMAGDKHYATDVLTGAAIGTGAALATVHLVTLRPIPNGVAIMIKVF